MAFALVAKFRGAPKGSVIIIPILQLWKLRARRICLPRVPQGGSAAHIQPWPLTHNCGPKVTLQFEGQHSAGCISRLYPGLCPCIRGSGQEGRPQLTGHVSSPRLLQQDSPPSLVIWLLRGFMGECPGRGMSNLGPWGCFSRPSRSPGPQALTQPPTNTKMAHLTESGSQSASSRKPALLPWPHGEEVNVA